MLQGAVRLATRTAVAACAAAIPIAFAIGALNGRWTIPYLPLLAAELAVVMALLLAAPLAVHAAAIACRRRAAAAHETYGCAAATLFALAWFARLKPSHQPFAAKPHLSIVGAAELILIAAAALAVYAAGSSRARRAWTRAGRVAGAIAIACALLAMFARVVEPRRDRPIAARLAGSGAHSLAPHSLSRPRVLVLAVDGLDWAPLEYLSRHGQLPTLAALVQHGRSYQLDAGGMAVSPPIWTAIYTGSASRSNMVGGYTEWRFAGLPHPVWFFPEFGAHPALMLDTLLDATQPLGLWRGDATSSENIQDPTIWEIASDAGRRVGIFDPAPFPVAGEHVNGRFVWRRDDGYLVEQGDGETSTARRVAAPMPSAFADASDMLSTEAARVDAADQTIAPDQDLAIYYTSVLDWLAHRHWDTVAALDASFERTPIAAGYRLVDAAAARLIARFGDPSVVVLLSDHGWELNEYEHSLGPHGVLAITGTGASGYGGTAHVLDVAPTLLSLLHVPIGEKMHAALPDVAPPSTVRRYARARPGRFVDAERVHDRERMDLLRTLGYVAR